MSQRFFRGIGALLVAFLAAACNTERPLLPPTIPSGAAADIGLKVSAPVPVSPVGTNVQLNTRAPQLIVREAKGNNATPTVSYQFQIQATTGEVVYEGTTSAGPANGVSNVQHQAILLGTNTNFRWRARAVSGPDGGPWTGFNSFVIANALSASSSNDEFRDFFFQVVAARNFPRPTVDALKAIEPDLTSVGIIESKALDGTPRGRIYLPTGNPNNKYSRSVDVITGFFADSQWKWDYRGQTTCEGICP